MRRSLILLSALIFFAGVSAMAQCNSSIEVKKAGINTVSSTGELEVLIKTSGSFTGKCVRFEGTKEIVVKTFSGTGSKTFQFNNLNKDRVYQVKVEFESEDAFLCRAKSSGDIVIKDRE